jgi:hypothetical protein
LHPVTANGSLIRRAPGDLGGNGFRGDLASLFGGTLGLLGVARRSRLPFARRKDGHVGVDIIEADRFPEEE